MNAWLQKNNVVTHDHNSGIDDPEDFAKYPSVS